jgi:hypothetical protein
MRWAQRDRSIAARVAEVLRRRLGYVASLLRAHGFDAAEAAWRAEVVAFAYMGWIDRAGIAEVSKAAARRWMRRLIALALTPAARGPLRRGARGARR